MKLDKLPTSILLPEGANEQLDALAARLTLAKGERHTRADAHRLALLAGIAKLDGPAKAKGEKRGQK